MEDITFSLMQLYEDTQLIGERFILPTKSTFSTLENFFFVPVDSVYYEIHVIKEKDYVWFHIDYGKPNPIDDKLTNIKTGKKKENLRQPDEVELTSQLFVLYSFDKKTLYISDARKKSLFEKVLLSKLDRKMEIKSYFKSKEEFVKVFKSIDKISFTDAKNLFNQDNERRQALKDLTGTDSPERFSLEVKYRKNSQITDFIKKLLSSRSENEIDSLVIQGTDESDFKFMFNVDSFVQKIFIKMKMQNNGKFDENQVKNTLLQRINE